MIGIDDGTSISDFKNLLLDNVDIAEFFVVGRILEQLFRPLAEWAPNPMFLATSCQPTDSFLTSVELFESANTAECKSRII